MKAPANPNKVQSRAYFQEFSVRESGVKNLYIPLEIEESSKRVDLYFEPGNSDLTKIDLEFQTASGEWVYLNTIDLPPSNGEIGYVFRGNSASYKYRINFHTNNDRFIFVQGVLAIIEW
ncbi:hypothetical protein [Pseudomonas faucium]|uniref:hypothetical protein n=1 Tax=Pseudomonas faucium TaxID=2740518 RepID=UPI0039C31CFE